MPRAYRNPLHLITCGMRLHELRRWFGWLTTNNVTALSEVDTWHAEAYLLFRSHRRNAAGQIIAETSPGLRVHAALTVTDLVGYRDLFTADRYRLDFLPWHGHSPSAVGGARSGGECKTPPLPQEVLQPMLAAALYVVEHIGTPLADLLPAVDAHVDAAQWRRLPEARHAPRQALADLMPSLIASGQPLPEVDSGTVTRRLKQGWNPHDPLLSLNIAQLIQLCGRTTFRYQWLAQLRPTLEPAVSALGLARPWARDATTIPHAGGGHRIPWTLPMVSHEIRGLTDIVRTACFLVVATISGMRAGEIMELRRHCQQRHDPTPGMVRYKLAGHIIKRQPYGGTEDTWTVIEPVYQAAALASRLPHRHDDQELLFGRFHDNGYLTFRSWVNGPAGQRLGLRPIPCQTMHPQMLRRALALELAHRPYGLLAAKIHLKHVTVAVTEGYAARPGGSQAALLADVNKHEQQRNLDLLVAEFRNYQQGLIPSGPGARDLTSLFASIGNTENPGHPLIQHNDQDLHSLLRKRAETLHIGVANYCWFTDPSKALCLKLAGTPEAEKPLVGLCDSARCPQATHHPCHRPVWAQTVEANQKLLHQIGRGNPHEKARLQTEIQRAQRILDAIDQSSPTPSE